METVWMANGAKKDYYDCRICGLETVVLCIYDGSGFTVLFISYKMRAQRMQGKVNSPNGDTVREQTSSYLSPLLPTYSPFSPDAFFDRREGKPKKENYGKRKTSTQVQPIPRSCSLPYYQIEKKRCFFVGFGQIDPRGRASMPRCRCQVLLGVLVRSSTRACLILWLDLAYAGPRSGQVQVRSQVQGYLPTRAPPLN
ncbi:uncharacterized protein GGS22DRAFT_66367 [Annulohypoxylon maeteangense]|uniref:uncharacterized protein n=1 Tax=Annulohypoxylon maeteangense TaxID=1927788 RepID=UPI002007C5F2|nr:uncharacterized protein GGS22DRAFT_66367 [Annulohypoxylon maeteangense]KAI0889033.1 hypothetical protein GGS22DRAFT_66367 [Annulohypoxylon maeteangense]